MEVRGLLKLWNEWGMQILVLVSFLLQVFLLTFGGMRRRSSSAVLRVSLWLAYLLADSTAIYTLGHLSVVSGSHKHKLVAFWAPFLLLHLGGPENITAYALEDNSLWLRHLQTLAVQVLGAAYVMYRYMASSGTLLLLASICMFAAGLLKYGERILALKRGNISSIRTNINVIHYAKNPCDYLLQDTSEERILRIAHSHLTICKGLLTNYWIVHPKIEQCPINVAMNIYKLIEMELSLMYDILYTKAAVIHTCEPAGKRLWKGSIGQYNFFHLCIHKRDTRNELGGRLAITMRLEYWWNKLHCSGTDSFSVHDLKNLVLQALPENSKDMYFKSRGRFILKEQMVYKDLARWSVNIEFDESIFVWHIATEVYISQSKHAEAEHDQEKLIEAAKVMSNYMMFLLAVKPDMLPGRMDEDTFIRESNKRDVDSTVSSLDVPSGSRMQQREEKLAQEFFDMYHTHPKGDDKSYRSPDVERGVLLAKELIDLGRHDTLELILGVWVEMVLYAAQQCRLDSHARQLSNGGEFMTIVWLLAHHFMPYDTVDIAIPKIED
uniref:DUF4220 domain-containing protein n=1 Tax=Leersia perrieri TaxID=77586 RepID=A0A0D9VAQ2_9ORYZ